MLVNSPSQSFAIRIEALRSKIIKFLATDEGDITPYSIPSWFNFASNFWRFTDDFEGITEYSTLDERRKGELLYE